MRATSVAGAAIAIVSSLLLFGCVAQNTFDARRRTIVAQNATWTVIAIGDLDSSARWLGVNLVRFEIQRDGSLYASGDLYSAGRHDRPFSVQYDEVAWMTSNAVRFATRPSAEPPTRNIVVRNNARIPIKWLRIRATDLFLVFDVPPGATVNVVARDWGASYITAEGQLNDAPVNRVRGNFDPGAKGAEIVVDPDGLRVVGRLQ